MKTQRMYTQDTLREDYPAMAEAVDQIFSIRGAKTNYAAFWINYCGKYKWPNGNPRQVSLGHIIDFLYQMGCEIEYRITMPKTGEVITA